MAAGMGIDRSGNGNHWGENGAQFVASQWLGRTRCCVDTPTNNFAVMNPISLGEKDTGDSNNAFVLSMGNRKNTLPGETYATATIRPTSGKWYAEAYISQNSTHGPNVRYVNIDYSSTGATGSHSGSWNMYFRETSSQLYRYAETTADNSPLGSVDLNAGNILQWAWDCDSGKCWIGNNNSNWRDASKGTTGDPEAGSNPTFTLSAGQVAKFLSPSISEGSDTGIYTINFGQDASMAGQRNLAGYDAPFTDSEGNGSFFYEPPDGFLAVCTKNLPEPSIKPKEHFNTILYTGDASADRAITGVGFAPDFVWAKERSNTAHHVLVDSVRGTSSGGRLSINRADAEDNTGGVTIGSFDSDGFTTGSSYSFLNGSTPLVAYNWKANGSGSANTAGSTNSTVSVNTAAGFSIVAYTGTSGPDTIGHGLGAIPQVIIVKDRTTGNQEWLMYNSFNTDDPETEYMRVDTTAATADNTFWNDTSPTSTVFSVGDARPSNSAHGDNYIAYCWTPIDGFSNFGKYKGNAQADGAFIYTGFRPAWIIRKPMTRTGHWMIQNTKSNPQNVADKVIFANDSANEYTDPAADTKADILSNGFKIYTADDNSNDDETYLYMAFAEFPTKYTNAR